MGDEHTYPEIYELSFEVSEVTNDTGIDPTNYNTIKYYVEYKFPNVQSTTTIYNDKLGIIDLPNSNTSNRTSANIDLHVL